MRVKYQVLPLRPYPGVIHLFRDLGHMRAYYEATTGDRYSYHDDVTGGRFIRLDGKRSDQTIWLVYARRPHVLAHEFSHVLLKTFGDIGSDPGCGNGEPFCYMLSQLMLDAR